MFILTLALPLIPSRRRSAAGAWVKRAETSRGLSLYVCVYR